MKKTAVFILALLLTGSLYSQDEPEIQYGVSFSLVCMEFSGSHSQIPEKISLFFEEIQKQELQSKIQGDLFGIFFDSPLLAKSGRPVYALGFRIGPDVPVKAPLLKLLYEYEKVAIIIHHGPFETVANSFNILLPFIEENGLEIAGPPAETWIGDPNRDKPEDLKTKIIIPVREKSI